MTHAPCISALPGGTLKHIFSRLSAEELAKLACVSKDCRQMLSHVGHVTLDIEFQKGRNFSFRDEFSLVEFKATGLKRFLSSLAAANAQVNVLAVRVLNWDRMFPVELKDAKYLGRIFCSCFELCQHQLQQLTLQGCPVSFKALTVLLDMPNLCSLEVNLPTVVHQPLSLLGSSLAFKHLRSLSWQNSVLIQPVCAAFFEEFGSGWFYHLDQGTPHMRHCVSIWNIATRAQAAEILASNTQLRDLTLYSTVFAEGFKLPPQLRRLTLVRCTFESPDILAACTGLESLKLVACSGQLPSDNFYRIPDKLLTIEQFVQFTETLAATVMNMTTLTHLTISVGYFHVTNALQEHLAQCGSLRSFELQRFGGSLMPVRLAEDTELADLECDSFRYGDEGRHAAHCTGHSRTVRHPSLLELTLTGVHDSFFTAAIKSRVRRIQDAPRGVNVICPELQTLTVALEPTDAQYLVDSINLCCPQLKHLHCSGGDTVKLLRNADPMPAGLLHVTFTSHVRDCTDSQFGAGAGLAKYCQCSFRLLEELEATSTSNFALLELLAASKLPALKRIWLHVGVLAPLSANFDDVHRISLAVWHSIRLGCPRLRQVVVHVNVPQVPAKMLPALLALASLPDIQVDVQRAAG